MNSAMKSGMKSDVQPCWLAEGRCEVVVQEQVQRRPFRFAVDRDILLVVDTHDSVSDVSQLAGDPAHAPALIDRALRGQGLMDGDCAVVVHATARRPADYDALFTAYPSEWWASVQSWAAEADHVVAIVPVVALLWASLEEGQALVYRDAAKFTFLANIDGRPAMVSTRAFSEDPADIVSTATLLCDSVEAQLLRDAGGASSGKPFTSLGWYGRMLPAGDDGGPDAEMASRTAQRLGLELLPVMHERVSEGEASFWTCLPALRQHFSARLMANPPVDRYALQARHLLPAASAAAVAASALALVGAVVMAGLSAAEYANARTVDAEAASLKQATAARLAQEQLPQGFKETVALVDRLGALLDRPDTTRLAQALRLAGSGGVQVMRMYTVAVQGGGRRDAAEQAPRVLVDAVVRSDATLPVQEALSRFVNTLRNAGYAALAIESPARGAQNVGVAVFSYELKRVDTGEGA